jgi:cellulose synthase (UDP-forming)
MLTKFPLFKSGLSVGQRFAYLSSTMFWLFPLTRMIFLLAPFFYLFFDLQIFTASSGDFIAYTLTYMMANIIMQNSLFGRWRWPWISELYEYIQSVHLLPALVSVLFNPKKPTFRVTAKDETTFRSRVSEIGMPFYIIFFLLLLGVGFTAYRLATEPYKIGITLVVGGWNLFNLIIAGCALGVVSERREARRARRVPVERPCEIRSSNGEWLPAIIEDVSTQGVGVRLRSARVPFLKDSLGAIRFAPTAKITDNELNVEVRNIMTVEGALVLGCHFVLDRTNDYRLLADLLYGSSAQWANLQEARRSDIGIIGGTLRFLGIALFQTTRGLTYLVRFRQQPVAQNQSRRRTA